MQESRVHPGSIEPGCTLGAQRAGRPGPAFRPSIAASRGLYLGFPTESAIIPLRLSCFCVRAAAGLLASSPVAAQQRVVPPSSEALRLSYAPIVQRVTPAVVTVSAAKTVENRNPLMDDPFFRRFFGPQFCMPNEQNQRSLGS